MFLKDTTAFFVTGFLCLTAAAGLEAAGGSDVAAEIIVDAGKLTRIDTPVSASLASIPLPLDSGFRLEEIKGKESRPVASQIEPGSEPRLWWILSGTTRAGSKRHFRLVRKQAEIEPIVRTLLHERSLEIVAGTDKVLRYHHAPVPPPEGVHEKYQRSAFIHPLWSPSGEALTRTHPPDHIHHMGLWSPWTKTEFEGRSVDFWNLGQGQGTVRFVRFLTRTAGPVFGGFSALQEHFDRSAPEGGKAALNEEYEVKVFPAGEGKGWLLDFITTQSCASESPLKLFKYRYGGFGFRAAESWNKGNYLTSEGRKREDGHATRARWCHVFGPTAKGPAGILFMSHPQNHEHPEPVRIWNNRPEIFFNFCPVQQSDWILVPGRQYVQRYRLHVHDGTLSADDAERLWNDYAHPPKTEVYLSEGKDSK